MAQVQSKFTHAEYLALKREAEARSEVLDGVAFRGLDVRLPMARIYRKLDLVSRKAV